MRLDLLLLTLALLPGCGWRERTCIERVLRQDQEAGSAKRLSDTTARMRAISLSGCPGDFSAAYLNHIHAVEDLSKVQAVKDTVADVEGGWGTALRFGVGVLTLGDAVQANQKIQASFREVERIAALHGAAIPAPTSK
ncbi:MAG: hypothetical protein FJW39_00670 [Acidobacteria bacterium]|nr:hypothetical protein [Acidobacteriota bacterium]